MGLFTELDDVAIKAVANEDSSEDRNRRRRQLLRIADAGPKLFELLKVAVPDAEECAECSHGVAQCVCWAKEARDLIADLERAP
jgi:hypothetical protein